MDRRDFFLSLGAFATLAIVEHEKALAQGGGNVGIIYTGRYVFTIVVGETDQTLTDISKRLAPGQLMFTFDPVNFESPNAALASHLGIPVEQLPDPYCAVVDVDTQLVTQMILADPGIQYDGGKLVAATKEVRPGWKHDGTKFLARGFVVPQAKDGKATVDAVVWADPKSAPAGFVENDTLQVGDPIPGFVGNAPAEGVKPL